MISHCGEGTNAWGVWELSVCWWILKMWGLCEQRPALNETVLLLQTHHGKSCHFSCVPEGKEALTGTVSPQEPCHSHPPLFSLSVVTMGPRFTRNRLHFRYSMPLPEHVSWYFWFENSQYVDIDIDTDRDIDMGYGYICMYTYGTHTHTYTYVQRVSLDETGK